MAMLFLQILNYKIIQLILMDEFYILLHQIYQQSNFDEFFLQ
ncbi:hypothetical protein AC41_2420 [Escherichia coli 2-011-08_S3_C3]|nr:hypothetical protein ECDEC11A_2338 [Escherichia coli DEC11A]EHX03598.1 hypothetical protein ECDEC11B_2388 [Escherichia coli DEC11B]EHX47434.1 hypothetical protein ECDEC13A_2262 [Escherichia coli DEC13A]EHX61705.1 hypothetical protein ECDEC13B_2051 [Escherichia coli DEC13B]EHX64175.1 hypothetical protein ECDEC13D_2392 [Escherichia coli DEC13D]EHX73206.1 hypothetical protein ECDEC13E_2395 [Escherichia coli DEC13E]EHX88417.1 hypothetical protein ECDEC14C_2427 [Escherichia coli DEC14C]EHX9185